MEGKRKHSEISSENYDDGKTLPEYIDLGNNRRLFVSKFKSNTLVNIREFYNADGEMKPGKKGITMNLTQWAILKDSVDTIDQMIEQKK